jgi:hypothetical protein
MVTEHATDGRPWPIDPIGTPPPAPLPIPELGTPDDVSMALAQFAGSGGGGGSTVRTSDAAADPHSDAMRSAEGSEPVSDDDRNRYGLLLDHAAERGLLSTHDYEVRLGELAAATSVDRMRQIVTELPAFTPPVAAASSNRSRRSSSAVAPGTVLAAVSGRRRTSPWVLLGMLVLVIVVLLVFFAIYTEHLVRSHNVGFPPPPVAARPVSAPLP